ncbi:MAG: sulfonate transport system substrate-binding protein, partial [Alphaproteobacteria bacterium]|nr:sulfonate transport system substrate-binding protein [Alphaproteobacteria bacterium]
MKPWRFVVAFLFVALAALFGSFGARAESPIEFRVGYQKNGVLVIARQQAVLEKRLAQYGVVVKWLEFPSGPPLLDAMNAGSIDFGTTGDTPPIFAQSAAAAILYVAGQPITNGQAIIVPSNSTVRSVADLKGKRVGFMKGSSAHNIVVTALENAGLTYSDITPVYLSPPDASAAFARGSIDAWAIWDPYFAAAEKRQGARVLVRAQDVVQTNSFFLANREFARRSPQVLRDAIEALAETASWGETHRDEVAKSLAEVTGVDLDIQTVAAERSSFAIGRVTDDLIKTQQAVADRFHRLGLIPKPIVVREAVW